MIAFKFLVLICVAAVLISASIASGPCEKIEHHYFHTLALGYRKSCIMETSGIDSNDFLITSALDEAVEAFSAYQNKKVEYLPANLGETFPNLLALSVGYCSIKEIKKDNFKGIGKLRFLWLYSNQIEMIDADTFDFLPAVEEIAGNKIKKLNSRAFASLSQLRKVDLERNECIDGLFIGAGRIAEMRRVADSNCGFIPKACGVPKKASGTIVRGENFERGDFPWMVALYRKSKRKRQEYFCGGSVISDHHVLTAAHCLESLVPRDITAIFGAYDLDDTFEVGRLAQSPSRIFVHDHWNSQTDQFDADIAMLLMPEKVIFSSFVQPICLWESQTAPKASIGTVPGWGQSQNTSRDHETIPTMLHLPIHTNEDCFLAYPDLARVSSKRTFCAGSADGRGPCFGDSGGGFYVQDGNVFYLRGVVSSAWDVTIYGECLLKKYTIYTDAVKFKRWIDSTMTNN